MGKNVIAGRDFTPNSTDTKASGEEEEEEEEEEKKEEKEEEEGALRIASGEK